MKKTKIVCTLGPACKDVETLRGMINEGMNVSRINFSHGTHKSNKELIDNLKIARTELNKPVAIMLDNKGPEVRLKTFENGKTILKKGQKFILTTREVIGNNEIVSINYLGLPKDVKIGGAILLDDGLIELVIEEITETDIICHVINGSEISDNKGVNIPNTFLKLPALTQKDIEDIKFGIENDIDFIAASFIRSADDVLEIRKVLNNNGGSDVKIISKIENQMGVDNIDSIIKVSDGIMVARGDMGVEIPIEQMPAIQKSIIKKCYESGKPVITATQMLESMIRNPRPTRAEVTDVANAIYDGTSAIMLSGETSIGKYVVESVKIMAKIACETERDINYEKRLVNSKFQMGMSITNAISHSTCTTAHDLGATAIIAVTMSGNTARMVSKFRPTCPIIATTMSERVQRQLSISWGVVPLLSQRKKDTMELFDHAVEIAIQNNLITTGDLVIITAGIPAGVIGTTNALKVHVVGDILIKGKGLINKTATGILCVGKDIETILKNFHEKNILVVSKINEEILSLIKSSSGVIVESNDTSSDLINEVIKYEKPLIVGAKDATKILKQGIVATIDGTNGRVFNGIDIAK